MIEILPTQDESIGQYILQLQLGDEAKSLLLSEYSRLTDELELNRSYLRNCHQRISRLETTIAELSILYSASQKNLRCD